MLYQAWAKHYADTPFGMSCHKCHCQSAISVTTPHDVLCSSTVPQLHTALDDSLMFVPQLYRQASLINQHGNSVAFPPEGTPCAS